jgi:CarD family transcriptional regulator
MVEEALGILTTKAKGKKGMWNRRANDFQDRIVTGQLISMAEVLRDLNRGPGQLDASYSEQQIFETAMDFMTREIAAARQVTPTEARKLIEQHLAKAPQLNKGTAQPDGPDDEAAA